MNISYLKYHPSVIYRAILRKVVRKSTRDNPERYCRWFWVHCSSKTFERMAREAYRRMFASAKGKWQKLFRQLQCQEQWIDRIPYYLSGLSRAHFSDNLSRNSCIKAENSSTLYKFREGRKRLRPMGSNANRKNNAFLISWDKMTAAWQRSIRFGKVQHLNRALNCEWPFHMNWYWKCLQCREWCFYDYIIYARMIFFLFL